MAISSFAATYASTSGTNEFPNYNLFIGLYDENIREFYF